MATQQFSSILPIRFAMFANTESCASGLGSVLNQEQHSDQIVVTNGPQHLCRQDKFCARMIGQNLSNQADLTSMLSSKLRASAMPPAKTPASSKLANIGYIMKMAIQKYNVLIIT
jgi:hypothetical protein